MMENIAFSWSGGKDSALALHLALASGLKPQVLLCMVDERGYSRSNGVSTQILQQQALVLNLPLVLKESSWSNYESNLVEALTEIKHVYNVAQCAFGDIDIVAHRQFEELVCQQSGLSAYLPLWGKSRLEVKNEIIQLGIKSKLSVVSKKYAIDELLGAEYSELDFVCLELLGVDICGENGEFHTLVYDAPLFKQALNIEAGEIYDLEHVYLNRFIIRGINELLTYRQ
ncbi:MAG: adenosine nucleotide hydrolase [Burkholderiales bacterium]|nr:adenosine nucleotide hydrolase [Burkholderiales bacterium]